MPPQLRHLGADLVRLDAAGEVAAVAVIVLRRLEQPGRFAVGDPVAVAGDRIGRVEHGRPRDSADWLEGEHLVSPGDPGAGRRPAPAWSRGDPARHSPAREPGTRRTPGPWSRSGKPSGRVRPS